MNKLFRKMSECGIEVVSMKNKSNRLEQLFIGMLNEGRNNAA
jgi:ABC-2 type transport system ATP-binding protein